MWVRDGSHFINLEEVYRISEEFNEEKFMLHFDYKGKMENGLNIFLNRKRI